MFHMWKSEHKVWKSVIYFHYVGPRDWIQLTKPGGKCFYLLLCLAGPLEVTFNPKGDTYLIASRPRIL